MEADPNAPVAGDAESRIVALRHRHRNQLQNMSSLVNLFGRRLPAGDCRNAFTDLRVRFEALGFLNLDDCTPVGGVLSLNLAELAERLVQLLDPERHHRVAIDGAPVVVPERLADSAVQILAETMIELFRRGLPLEGAGDGEIAAGADGDWLIIRANASGTQRVADGASELGRTLAESHARSCGGTLSRSADGAFRVEARFPLGGLAR